ncbi:MAG: DUF3040 domain-containing protein, partial [Pseudonocardia sp.]|nr:DUF3040 domain-containing protein [Pseudonocardia sp.]
MLDDRERELLFGIERRLLVEDPELARTFGAPPTPAPRAHPYGAVLGRVAGLTLRAVLLRGPRPLSAAEVTTRQAAGPPRVTPEA